MTNYEYTENYTQIRQKLFKIYLKIYSKFCLKLYFQIDMADIKTAFERMYGKSLKSWIKGDTSGHYKHALYALVGEQRSNS